MSGCIAPRCQRAREVGAVFCGLHLTAPAGQRGGWISAERRRRKRANDPVVALDASNISKRLWIGSRPPLDRDLPDFDVLVLCAEEIQPERIAFSKAVIRCPLHDAILTSQELARTMVVARKVAEDISQGRRVLVTCAMGINRSALVTALALGLLTRMEPAQIITLIRAKRSAHCLSNDHFVEIIEHFVGARRRAVAP